LCVEVLDSPKTNDQAVEVLLATR